jgi:hypothetical protein
MKIQSMVSTNPPGKKHSNDICTNETLPQIITNHVLLTLFVIVVDALVVHQHAHRDTISSTMLEMKHHHLAPEEGPIVEGDHDECYDDLLMNYIKNKKQKNKCLYML